MRVMKSWLRLFLIFLLFLISIEARGDLLSLKLSGWVISESDLLREKELFPDLYCVRLFSVWEIKGEKGVKVWGITPTEFKDKNIFTVPCIKISSDSLNSIPDPGLSILAEDLINQLGLFAGKIIELNIERNLKSSRGLEFNKFKIFLSEFITRKIGVNMVVEPALMTEWTESEWREIDSMINEYILMLYDYDKNSLEPHNPAPIKKVKSDLERFLKLTIDPGKVILGIPTYAFIWSMEPEKGSRPYLGSLWLEDEFSEYFFTSISVKNYILSWSLSGEELVPDFLVCSPGGELICWSEDNGANYIYVKRGGGFYIIYYEDIQSYIEKFELAEEHNLKGVSFWLLGREDRLLTELVLQAETLEVKRFNSVQFQVLKKYFTNRSGLFFGDAPILDCNPIQRGSGNELIWKNYSSEY